MKRRKLIKAMSVAAGFGLSHKLAYAQKVPKVAVVGAGIVGASIAYYLSKQGGDVVVLEKSKPAVQASGNSFAWLNATYFDSPHSYFELRSESLLAYHRLQRELALPVHWGGSLEWYAEDDRQQELVSGVSRIRASGSQTRIIGKQDLSSIEANLQVDENARIAYAVGEGAVNPKAMTEVLLAAVVRNGGVVQYPAEVSAVQSIGNKVRVATQNDTLEADKVVLATGIDTNSILKMAGVNQEPMLPATPGILVTTKPMPQILNAVVYTNKTHIHQLLDGRVIVGEKAGPPQTSQHGSYLQGKPNQYPDPSLAAEHARRVLAIAQDYLPQLGNAEAESVGIGWRPLPKDGLPVLGQPAGAPGIYVAATHSGVTLAPIIGELASQEILEDVRLEQLSPYRIERF